MSSANCDARLKSWSFHFSRHQHRCQWSTRISFVIPKALNRRRVVLNRRKVHGHTSPSRFKVVESPADFVASKTEVTILSGSPCSSEPFSTNIESKHAGKVEKNPKRNVTFSPVVNVVESEIRISENEICATWWQIMERRKMKNNCAAKVKWVKKSSLVVDREDSSRGLEQYIDAREVKALRRRVMEAVFQEQHLQLKQGIYNPELIMRASVTCSAFCRQKAYRRGLKDQATSK